MTDEPTFEGRGRGRPKTGQGRKLDTRISEDLSAAVQRHAEANFMTWPEAVRDAIARGLNVARK